MCVCVYVSVWYCDFNTSNVKTEEFVLYRNPYPCGDVTEEKRELYSNFALEANQTSIVGEFSL